MIYLLFLRFSFSITYKSSYFRKMLIAKINVSILSLKHLPPSLPIITTVQIRDCKVYLQDTIYYSGTVNDTGRLIPRYICHNVRSARNVVESAGEHSLSRWLSFAGRKCLLPPFRDSFWEVGAKPRSLYLIFYSYREAVMREVG